MWKVWQKEYWKGKGIGRLHYHFVHQTIYSIQGILEESLETDQGKIVCHSLEK